MSTTERRRRSDGDSDQAGKHADCGSDGDQDPNCAHVDGDRRDGDARTDIYPGQHADCDGDLGANRTGSTDSNGGCCQYGNSDAKRGAPFGLSYGNCSGDGQAQVY